MRGPRPAQNSNFNSAISACMPADGVTPNSGCAYGEMPDWDTSLVTDMSYAFGCRGAAPVS